MRCESVHTSRHVAGCVLMSSGLALSPTSPDLSALHHLPPDADHAGPLHVAEFADLIIVELFGRGRPFGLGSTRGDGALPEPLRASRPFELFRQFTEPFKDEPPKTLESAEAALAFLVAQGMAEVVGEDVIVPVRFRDQVEVTR
jgi:hypothetical protein